MMFKNYLKISIRNLLKHKFFSVINIAGLSIGLAACMLIFMYISGEQSFDDYQKNKKRIFRVTMEWQTGSGNIAYALNPPPVAPALKQNYPQVESAARILKIGKKMVMRYEDKTFYEDPFLYVDPEIFEILTIPFIRGNPKTALDRPGKIVISERIAEKYFGNANPLGRRLDIDIQIDRLDYEVTGVVKNAPTNTHMKYDMFIPISVVEDMGWMNDWTWPGAYTYIKLAPNVDVQAFEEQIRHLSDDYIENESGANIGKYIYSVQPVTDIHLHSQLTFEAEAPGSLLSLYLFSAIGLLILLSAGMNFMNLATARSANRAKEIGIRKVVGAERLQLIQQFLGESLFMSFVSLGIAILLVKILLIIFNSFVGINFILVNLFQPRLLFPIILMALLAGLAAGSYPALFLSAFDPVSVLKGPISSGSRSYITRKILVVGQFTISIILIISTIVLFKQLSFMKGQYLGFDKEQKLVIPFQGWNPLEHNYEMIKNEFSAHPSISEASACSRVPGQGAGSFMTNLMGEDENKNQMMFYLLCDHDFIPQYNIKMLTGRSFKKEIGTDSSGACIINEAAVKSFGWDSPQEAIGKRLREGLYGLEVEIIGVAKDFHYRSLQIEVEPLIIEMLPQMFSQISLTFYSPSVKEALSWIERRWNELFPGKPFEYFFLDENFDRQYRAEEQTGKIVGALTFLALFVAFLGLFGLSAFTAEQRTKEIGIRKVLGASISGIVALLSKEFIKWVLLANLIAWPIAYYAMDRWLQNFAYRIGIGLWTFLLAGTLALGIALLTVSYHAIRAATTNPVEALRYE